MGVVSHFIKNFLRVVPIGVSTRGDFNEIDESLSHGNSENGTKSSSAPSKSQNPWLEMLVTSTSEVLVPGSTDDIFVLSDKCFDRPKLFSL